jgi:hypothetical protein
MNFDNAASYQADATTERERPYCTFGKPWRLRSGHPGSFSTSIDAGKFDGSLVQSSYRPVRRLIPKAIAVKRDVAAPTIRSASASGRRIATRGG